MEIGYPTDVKHVAHIGWDGHSGNFEESTGNQATQNIDEGIPSDEIADVPKKHKRKKTKSKAMSCEIEATIAQ
ncbi:hypothetical protein VNO77_41755 [Canavalia gladiata]|uniref:CRIB domain-containing protein n=1 Tax=Canavalia gladiata TaxID=3824 RepID=A0AAN9K1F8_CANGL